MRSRSSLGAYLRRQYSRLGAAKAIMATAHKLTRIVYHLMCYGEAYVKQDKSAYAEQVRKRLEKQERFRKHGWDAAYFPSQMTGEIRLSWLVTRCG